MSNQAAKKTKQPDTKARRITAAIPPNLLSHAEAQAASSHGGNLSRYLQSLIEADMKGGARSTDTAPLETLLREFVGDDAVPDGIDKIKQRAALAALLEGYAGFLHHFDKAGNDLRTAHDWQVGVVPVALVDNALTAIEHKSLERAGNDIHLLAWFCGPAFEQRRHLRDLASKLGPKPAKK